jgi:hypothetical protein
MNFTFRRKHQVLLKTKKLAELFKPRFLKKRWTISPFSYLPRPGMEVYANN